MWDISHVQSTCYLNSLVLLACSQKLAYITQSEPGSVLRVSPIYSTGKEKETLPVRIISDESEPSFSHSPIISFSPSSASSNSHQSRSHNPNCRHLLRQGNDPKLKSLIYLLTPSISLFALCITYQMSTRIFDRLKTINFRAPATLQLSDLELSMQFLDIFRSVEGKKKKKKLRRFQFLLSVISEATTVQTDILLFVLFR